MRNNVLQPEEIPSDVREAYDFTSQSVEFHFTERRPVMMIDRVCLRCKRRDRTAVTTIRQSIRRNKITGLCRHCVGSLPRDQPSGDRAYNWKGGRTIRPDGYVFIRQGDHPKASNGYVQEHRLVMEQSLGRYLFPNETIHHKNGVKSDNRIENLELWSSNHSDGQRYDDLSDEQLRELISFLESLLSSRLAEKPEPEYSGQHSRPYQS